MSTKKIALIGRGAAGFGASLALADTKYSGEVTVFDVVNNPKINQIKTTPPTSWSNYDFKEVSSGTNFLNSRSLFPSVTYFGSKIEKQKTHNSKGSIWTGGIQGGLFNFWSASTFPLAKWDYIGWPLDNEIMKDYYSKISNSIKISGNPEEFLDIYPSIGNFTPPIKILPTLNYLNQSMKANPLFKGEYEFTSGINRVAVSTSPNNHSCTYCGECFTGCYRNSIFNASNAFDQNITRMWTKTVNDKVIRLKQKNLGWYIETQSTEIHGPYDRVFVGAGCPGTIKIMMNSMELPEAGPVLDNDSYMFAILDTKGKWESITQSIAISNLIVAAKSKINELNFAQIHISPFPDLLMRHFLPSQFWKIGTKASSFLRSKLIFGKIYLSSNYSKHYTFKRSNDEKFEIHKFEHEQSRIMVSQILNEFKKTLSPLGYSILPGLILNKTSSHYAGPFSFEKIRSRTGEILPKVHLIDSTTFPSSPAQPLSYTIMANAYRIIEEVLK